MRPNTHTTNGNTTTTYNSTKEILIYLKQRPSLSLCTCSVIMITRWRKKNKALEANDSPENTTFSRISKPYNAPLTSSPQQQSKLPTWKSPKPGSINCIPRMNGVNPNVVGCTTFLMGGQYYPGKDKNRVHLRRRTLWYRTFWSSALRRILSAVAVVYLLFFYLFNPGLRLILHYGQILSNNQNSSSDISSLMKNKTAGARENTKHIMKRIRDIKDKNRNGLRRKGIPKWFHHDDKEYAQEVGNNIDGTLLKSDDPDIPASSIEEIDDLVEPNESTLRTLENISHHNSKSLCPRDVDQIATTLVLQATFDRLPLIRQTCRRWKSPIKLVVYLTLDEAENMWDETIKEYNTFCNNLSLIPHISKTKDERRHAYPINLMRNIGLDHVTTSHVLVLDIDLIPSTNLDYELATAIELAIEARMDDDGDRGIDPKDAIIVPAFERKSPIACETLQDCQHLSKEDASFIPNTMIELRSCLSDKECIVFQSDMNMEGHADTRSMSWLNKEDTSILTNIECFHSIRYEPYVVVPWCPFMKNAEQMLGNTGPRSPYYDERFHGYGKNKIQQIAHLRERGYAFMVMPPMGFIIHHPHPESKTKEVWNDRVSNLLHRQMDELYLRYLQDLQHEYQYERIMTPICKKIY